MRMRVTAICPTFGRPAYVAKAIRCFLSQTWEDKELLILDDGAEPCFSVVPHDSRIRYEYGQPGTWRTLGDKRNAANAMANGDFIWHLDDDDWSAPERMKEQVLGIEGTGFPVVGYNSMYYYRVSDGETFSYKYTAQGHYALGTSLCYRTSYWEKHPFESRYVGEDSHFVLPAATRGELLSIEGWGMMVARSLSNSTAKPFLGDPYNFPRVPRKMLPQAFFDAENEQ